MNQATVQDTVTSLTKKNSQGPPKSEAKMNQVQPNEEKKYELSNINGKVILSSGQFERRCSNCLKKKKVDFKRLSDAQKRERMYYYWHLIRLNIKLARIPKFIRNLKKELMGINVDADLDGEHSDELEGDNKKELAWYILDHKGKFVFLWQTIINIMNWTVAILLPLYLVIEAGDFEKDESAQNFQIYANYALWVTDFFQVFEVIFKFIKSDATNREFKQIAITYISSVNFPLDLLVTLPSIISLHKNQYIQCTKFLRMLYFGRLFESMFVFLQKLMPGQSAHIVKETVSYIVICLSMLLLAHFCACFWLYLGQEDQYKPSSERLSWYYNSANGFAGYSAWQLYIFSYYWVFEVFATVGYGDVTGKTKNEMIFSVMLEFLGMSFFSLLMGTTVSFASSVNTSYNSFYDSKIMHLDQWVMRIDRSCKDYNFDQRLYLTILRQCEEAFQFDFNIIIEEQEFYQKMTPRMQTELINLLFSEFRFNFKHLFDWQEQGFVNEVIINLYVRIYPLQNVVLQPEGKSFSEFMMITNGSVGIHHQKSRALYQLPQFSYIGDWQLLFNLKSIYNYKSYCEPEQEYEPTRIMCLKKSKFLNLCSLYPRTAANFKLRALERRKRIADEIDIELQNELRIKSKFIHVIKNNSKREKELEYLEKKIIEQINELNTSYETEKSKIKKQQESNQKDVSEEILELLNITDNVHKQLQKFEKDKKWLKINLQPFGDEQQTDSEPELDFISRQEIKLKHFIREVVGGKYEERDQRRQRKN